MTDVKDEAALQDELVQKLRSDAGLSAPGDSGPEEWMYQLRGLMQDIRRMFLVYEFGIKALSTKIEILRQEFEQGHDYSPIEHVRSRLKSSESVLRKALSRGCPLTVDAIRGEITDIAGIRITCSFVSDVYWIAEMLSKQSDITVLETKDYIDEPKPNGYRSLHLIVQVPVFLSQHTEHVTVELQIRTIAMDFWASMEHKLSYKYDTNMPPHLAEQISTTAEIAAELDERMGRLREEIRPSPNGSA
ncbi:MAG TPA: GTP pyrophosphokinase family protein [Candidatus Agrococcus pullicola]|uniref:GTP pyrophosphokinase family protein n=1 Tax=Candidatus Agrococcus pullicola TaxID=2838429 RepID=A0A9D1YVL0_9MICO|nr:GTP pyrophosphokinase family protein [Candidatus Agrococcus pullicola]